MVGIGSGSAKKDPPAKFVKPAPQPAAPSLPLTAAKKARKKATTKKARKKAPAKPKAPAIDTSKLTLAEATERCAEIYRLETLVEKKRATHELARAGAKSAKAALAKAEDALAKEIHDQRVGAGPLFDGKAEA